MGRFETFTLAIFEMAQYWNKIASEEMKPYGLRAAHATYLVMLYRNPDGITAAKLCAECNKDKAEISRAVLLMEQKGLIKKENVANNSYRALIKLTDEGIKAAKQVKGRADLAADEGGKGLTEKERETFYYALSVISANLKKISEEGLPKNKGEGK